MTDKVDCAIWIYDMELQRKKRIRLQTLLNRVNHTLRHENKMYWGIKGERMNKFEKWLEQCPVEYDEIHETSDKDILTINFHGKDIYWHTIGKE